jgi:hypothetical protein
MDITMKLPTRAMRTLLLLPENFCGSVIFHKSASGLFSVEVRHQERYTPTTDDMIDLSHTMQAGGPLERKPPRR